MIPQTTAAVLYSGQPRSMLIYAGILPNHVSFFDATLGKGQWDSFFFADAGGSTDPGALWSGTSGSSGECATIKDRGPVCNVPGL